VVFDLGGPEVIQSVRSKMLKNVNKHHENIMKYSLNYLCLLVFQQYFLLILHKVHKKCVSIEQKKVINSTAGLKSTTNGRYYPTGC
jgi:hypothetical protein